MKKFIIEIPEDIKEAATVHLVSFEKCRPSWWEEAYQIGLNDAWKTASKLYSKITTRDTEYIFDVDDANDAFGEALSKFTGVEAIDRIHKYEKGKYEKKKKAPTADVRENVHGEWLINPDGYYPYCSHCKQEPQGHVMTDFCPNCGADMRKEAQNERIN